MLRSVMSFIVLIFLSQQAFTQKKDSLFVEQGTDGWVLYHKVRKGETIFSVARNYHVPPAMLGDANKMTLRQSLQPGNKIQIPLGAYNLKTDNGMYTDEMRPLFHKLEEGESLKRIAKNSNINQRRLLDWNNLTANDVYEGVILKVGWLLYDVTGVTQPQDNITMVAKDTITKPNISPVTPSVSKQVGITKDTVVRIPKQIDSTDSSDLEKSEAELLYEEQTTNGTVTEKGPAAFFKSNNPGASFLYAFHNEAPKGTIIKVRNINNGKIVYVKVLGPVPNTGLYHKAIIGISNRARSILGVRDEKAWCELTYAK